MGRRAVEALGQQLAPPRPSARLEALRASLSRDGASLKNSIVPVANEIAHQQGRSHDFVDGPADVEMLLAWCISFSPITCFSAAGHRLLATRFSHPNRPATPECPEVFVFSDLKT